MFVFDDFDMHNLNIVGVVEYASSDSAACDYLWRCEEEIEINFKN